ncbi:MAG: methylase, partial [Clostridiales bacterium]|nr:methylase [Clostridiales bacterium]
ESQPFWLSLLRDVYGVEHPEEYITFEEQVHLDHTSFIDGMIAATHVMIEQKSLGKNLNSAIKQSDGSLLTPFEQAKRYILELPVSQHPRWVVTCNFAEFYVYDMERPGGDPEIILLENLEKEYYRLQFLVDTGNEHIKHEMEVSIAAGEIVGLIYDAFEKQYADPTSAQTLHSLNVLCVRLVFCLYAENAGIFGHYGMFHDYLAEFDTKKMRKALIELFEILDTPAEERDPYLSDDNPLLAAFPYVNGGLFSDENIEIPPFTDEIRDLLLDRASEGFDWSDISPTIFGAVFESTLNPETRRSGGMHYTSIENIHKVIDPLFLDDLKKEFEEIKSISVVKTREQKLRDFRRKLGMTNYLDPACGSGNFLTESYLSLRRLENDVLRELAHDQMAFGDANLNPIQVSIGQFYGIEINDFAVTVAKTALWIAEHQMMRETEEILLMNLDFLPLKSYSNIIEGNALRLDWESVVPREKLNFIISNPPFVGASMMTAEQKNDAVAIFGKGKRVNSIDYVGAWYYKAAAMMQSSDIHAAFVSTNSITQGEQVAPLWEKLYKNYNIHIDFAYRTFRWDSEASLKAHVHCVIIGFSAGAASGQCKLYDNGNMKLVSEINPYLVEAAPVFVESRGTPLCDVPGITYGNKPSDGGNLILSEEERDEMLAKDPSISVCLRRYVGSRDFINSNEKRYCLWLRDISPSFYRKNKEIMRRLEAVRQMRLASSAAPTRALADKPYLFFSAPQTDENYLCIPEVSSEQRRYIPIGFMASDIIASNTVSIVPGASLYHFGVLVSNVHMSWMRTIAGRLKSDYRYSGSIVYNNFPWPSPTDTQREKVEKTAQAILDARALYPDCSLADLYDSLTMPPELRKAHQANDVAVMEAYGFTKDSPAYASESACVAELMRMYQELTE